MQVFFSLDQQGRPANSQEVFGTMRVLDNSAMHTDLVTGVYTYQDGSTVRESTISALVTNDDQLTLIKRYAARFNQESILLVDDKGQASLVFIKDGSSVSLGRWTNVIDIKGLNAYTIVNGLYFACVA